MIRFDRKDYEDRVVATLRKEFLDLKGRRILVEDVRIDRSTPRHETRSSNTISGSVLVAEHLQFVEVLFQAADNDHVALFEDGVAFGDGSGLAFGFQGEDREAAFAGEL